MINCENKVKRSVKPKTSVLYQQLDAISFEKILIIMFGRKQFKLRYSLEPMLVAACGVAVDPNKYCFVVALELYFKQVKVRTNR